MNKALCNECGRLVEAEPQQRDGRILLVKHCPECGVNETVISSDAERYLKKRKLDGEHPAPAGCSLNCLECRHKNQPSFIFVDITNRCNCNCPICINNTPSMGFLFEPPLEYFEKLFEHFAELESRPAVQLFGGEPTVRKDLFEIIKIAQSYGLRVRVVTNGLRLADEEYCRSLVATRAPADLLPSVAEAPALVVMPGDPDLVATPSDEMPVYLAVTHRKNVQAVPVQTDLGRIGNRKADVHHLSRIFHAVPRVRAAHRQARHRADQPHYPCPRDPSAVHSRTSLRENLPVVGQYTR